MRHNDIVKMLYPGPNWRYRNRSNKEAKSIYEWAMNLPSLYDQEDANKLVEWYYQGETEYLKDISNCNGYHYTIVDLVARIIINKVPEIDNYLSLGLSMDELKEFIILSGVMKGKGTISSSTVENLRLVKSKLDLKSSTKGNSGGDRLGEWEIVEQDKASITLYNQNTNWVEKFNLRGENIMKNLEIGQVVKYRSNSTDLIHSGKVQAFTTDDRIVLMNTNSNVTVLVSPSSIIEEPEKFEHGRMYDITLESGDRRNAVAIDSIKGMVLIYNSVILKVNPVIEANPKLSRVRTIGMAMLK